MSKEKQPTYLQIFSMTDHAKPLNDRYQGNYKGLNAERTTSGFTDGELTIHSKTEFQQGGFSEDAFEKANVILAYRHSDTGVLQGTSETLTLLDTLPWTDMPGLEVREIRPDSGAVRLKLWFQEFDANPNQNNCIRFGNTIVYVKNHGPVEKIDRKDTEKIENGPMTLHRLPVDNEISLAPPSGSGLQVKAGQEISSDGE